MSARRRSGAKRSPAPRRPGIASSPARPAGTEVHLLFGALTDLLADHIGDVLPRLPAPQRRAIEVVLLLDEDRGRPAEPRTVAAGVLGLIRELVRDDPILLAIDDAQWLDPASAMVIEYALRRLWRRAGRHPRVLAIRSPVGHRPGRAARAGSRARLRTAAGARVTLGPLSIGAIHRVLRMRTGEAVPRPLLRRIHEASGGNPFYALEIARAMDGGRQRVDQRRAAGAHRQPA